MFRLAEAAAQQVTEAHLRQAATTLEEAEAWVQLYQNLQYVLINVTTGAAATLCRQYQHEIGLEVPRQPNIRFALPVGTRSIGYLTKLLKPTFDSNNFEESFSNWEFEPDEYERDNNTQLPDQVKIAVLMNETKRPVTTTPSPCGWSNTNLHRHQINHHGKLQDNYSIHQIPARRIIQCFNKFQWRSCTNGHRSHQKRKRKVQEQRKEMKGQRRERQERKRLWIP